MKIGVLRIGQATYTEEFLRKICNLEDYGHEIDIKTVSKVKTNEKHNIYALKEDIRNVLQSLLDTCDSVCTYADIFTEIKDYMDNEVLKKKYGEKFIQI